MLYHSIFLTNKNDKNAENYEKIKKLIFQFAKKNRNKTKEECEAELQISCKQ